MAKSTKSHQTHLNNRGMGKAVTSAPPVYLGQHMDKDFPLFPFLAQLETVFPDAPTQLHMVVDALQLIAFGLLPYHRWGNAAFGVLRALFFTHVPLFDPMILSAGFAATLVVCIVLVLLLLLAFGNAVTYVLSDVDPGAAHHVGWAAFLSKLLLYPVVSIGYVPLLQNLMSISMCGWLPTGGPGDDTPPAKIYLVWFSSNVECYTGVATLAIAVTVIGVVLVVGFAYLFDTMFFDINPMSRHRLSRASSTLDGIYVLFRLVSVALMHFFLVTDNMVYFCVWMATSSLVLAIAYMYTLPYYRRHANQLRIASLLTCSMYSILSATTYATPVWTEFQSNSNADIAIILSVLPFAWYLFYYVLAEVRTSRIFLSAMELLHEGAIPESITHFPKNLPASEDIFETNKELISDLLDGQTTSPQSPLTGAGGSSGVLKPGGGRGDADDDDDEAAKLFHFTVPYINYVTFALDVELAARFLVFVRRFTAKELTPYQLTYTAKLFCKGCAKFRQSSSMRLHTAVFLLFHGLKPRLAMAQLGVLKSMEASLSERYQAWLLQKRINQTLRIGESSRVESFTKAKRRQRDALCNTADFWALLLNDDVDKNALSNATRALLTAKEEVMHNYRILLSSASPSMDALACYTHFCEDVLNEPEVAAQCLQCLRELQEQKVSNTMRGAKVRVEGEAMTQIPLEFEDDQNEESSRNQTIDGVSMALLAASAATLVLLAGFLAMIVSTTTEATITAMTRAGELRALGVRCSVASTELIHLDAAGENITNKEREVLALQQDFRALHNSLTYSFKFTNPEHHTAYASSQALRLAHNVSVNFWTLGTAVSVALRDVAANRGNSVFKDWVTNTLPTDVVYAINTTVTVTSHEYSTTQQMRLVIACILLGVALVAVVVASTVVLQSSTKIDSVRMDIFALFTLIPRRALKQLAKDSRAKLIDLEAFFALNSKDKVISLIGNASEQPGDGGLRLGGNEQQGGVKSPLLPTGDAAKSMLDDGSESDANSRRGSEVGSTGGSQMSDDNGSQMGSQNSQRSPGERRKRRRQQRKDEADAEKAKSKHEPQKLLRLNVGADDAFNASSILLLMLISFAAIVTCVFAGVALGSIEKQTIHAEALRTFMETTGGAATSHRAVFVATRNYVQTGGRRYLEAYATAAVAQASQLADLNRLVRDQLDDGLSKSFFDTLETTTAVEEIQRMAMRLAFTSFPVQAVFARAVNASRWPHEEQQRYPSTAFLHVGSFLNRFGFVEGSAIDLARDGSTQLTRARTMVAWETYLVLHEHVLDKLRALNTNVKGLIADLEEEWMFTRTCLAIAIAGSFVLAAVTAYVMLFIRPFSPFMRSVSMTCLTVLLLLAGLLALGVSLGALATLQIEARSQKIVSKLEENANIKYNWDLAIRNEVDHAANYLVSDGYLLWLLKYRNVVEQDFSTFVVNPIADVEHIMRDLPTRFVSQDTRDTVVAHVNDLVRHVNAVKALDSIAVKLIFTATSIMPKHAAAVARFNQTFLSQFNWDFAAEANYRLTYATYRSVDDPRYFYSSFAEDRLLPVSNLTNIATQTIISHRMDDLQTLVNGVLQHIFADMMAITLQALTSRGDLYEVLTIVTIAAAAAASLLSFGMVGYTLIAGAIIATSKVSEASAPSSSSSKSGKGAAGGGGSQGRSSSAQSKVQNTGLSMTTKAYIGQSFIGLLLAAILACSIAAVALTTGTPIVLDAATNRMYIVANTRRITNTMASNPDFVAEGQLQLRNEYFRIVASTKTLYFNNRFEYFGVDKDGAQDAWLFSRAVSYANQAYQFASGSNLFTESSSDETSDAGNNRYTCSVALGQSHLNKISRGVGLIYGESWPSVLYTMAYAHASQIPELIEELSGLYDPLILGLYNSNELYRKFYAKEEATWLNIIVVLSIICIVFILFQYGVVLRWFINSLVLEESTARLMLRIIPQEIRESNKQIQMFLESGKVKSSTDDISDAIIAMSSQPVIAIDQRGIIIRFSAASEKVFGYSASEIVGSNVKLLMPQEYATNHDHFLANYRRTGVKKVVDQVRRVRAVRKTGDQFLVELRVSELIFGDESVFIGFVKDVSSEVDLKLQDELNKYILDMSQDPIISMDGYGTILTVNRAVQNVFGYQRDEVVNENIKLLMPSEIALQHDGYLQKYRETGIRTVVNSSRMLQAQRKSGEVFHARITVREIKGASAGEGSIFIGFVADVTKEQLAIVQNEINDVIADLSPVPIIAINEKGTFVKFSRAACTLFQYTREELVTRGQNVQVLVPAKFGDHNVFLQNYFRTGVPKVVGFTRNILCQRKDKSIFPGTLTLREIKKSGMQPVFLGYCVDVTNSIQMEEAGKLSRAIMFFNMVPIIATTLKGIITQSNEAASQAFGYTSEELLGQNVNLLMSKHVADTHDNIIANYLRTKEKHSVGITRNVPAKRKNGEIFPTELSLREVPASENVEGCFFAYVRDISAQRATLQQFMINDTVTQLSVIPIIAINNHGTVESFSPAAEECFGYSASEVLGENVKMLMPQEIADVHDGHLDRYRRTKIKTIIDSSRVVNGRRRDGSLVPLEVSVKEIKKEGTQSSFVAYCRETMHDAALQEESKLGTIIRDLSSIPIVLIEATGEVKYANTAFCSEFRYDLPRDFIGKNISVIIPEDIAERHDDILAKYVARGDNAAAASPIVGKIRRLVGIRRDRSEVQLEVKVAEVRSTRSGKLQFVGFLRNLSSQLLLEQANHTIDTITNLSLVPIISIDHRGIVIKFSDAATTSFGYEAAEVLGNNIKMLMPEEVAEKHDAYLRSYFRTHVKNVIGNIVKQNGRRKDGSRFPLELSIKEIVKTGQNSLFIGYLRDASQDSMLEKSMQLSSMVTQLSPVPIIVVNRRGVIQTFNQAACTTFEYAAEEIIGQNVSAIMTANDAKYHDKHLKTYITTRIKSAIDENKTRTAVKRSGQQIQVEVCVKEVIPANGDMQDVSYLGFVRDMTELLTLQKAGIVNDTIASMSAIPLVAIMANGNIIKFSTSAEECFGYSSAEVIGKNVSMLMPDEIAVKHDSYLSNFRKKHVESEGEFKAVVTAKRRNGQRFPVEISIREVRKTGQQSMFVGYCRDISTAFEVLRQKLLCESAVQLSATPIISMTTEGKILSFNEAAEDCFGYSQNEVLQQNIKILMPKATADQHDGYLSAYARTGIKRVVDQNRLVTGKRKNGKKFSALVSVREVPISATEKFFCGYVRDNTAAAGLEHASLINESIVSLSSCAIVTITAQGIITMFSASAEGLFGYTAAETLGQNVSMLMNDPHRSRHDEYLLNYMTTKQAKVLGKVTRNLQAIRKDGSTFFVELQVSHIGVVSGDSDTGFVASIRDVDQAVKMLADVAIGRAQETFSLRSIVVIDEVGTIIRANLATSRLFGYAQNEMNGRNVKMLMPDEIASKHDRILSTYKTTGIRAVIGTSRRVFGKTKQGQLIELQINVTEIVREDGSKTFVGYLANSGMARDLVLSGSLSAALIALIPVPIVMITNVGVIIEFNPAAEKVFEFTASQVVGKNVKILMPEDIQKQHDKFLSSYFQTGEKKVIDKTRRVEGETKSGAKFPLTISVREIKKITGEIVFAAYLKPIL